MNRQALVLALAGALVTSPVLAQGKQEPKIKSLEPAEGPPGANVLVKGMNFSDKKEDVEVLAGGTKCLVLTCDLTSLRFLIPALPAPPAGPLRIEIKIKGEMATSNFKIIDPKDAQKDIARRDKERIKYEGASVYEDPFKQNESLLKITKFELTAGANPAVNVEGETSLPRDFFLVASFGTTGQEEHVLDTRRITIQNTKWKASFGPYTGKILLAGKYYVHVQFEMSKQSPLDLKRVGWPEKLSEGERTARDIVWKKEIKDVGTPEEIKKQDDEIKAHYVELCRKTTDCLEMLERAYCAAGKCYFRPASGSGFDEAAWGKWVQDRGLGQNDADLKKLKDDNRFLKGNFFNDKPWQEWAENDFFKRLGDAHKSHNEIKAKYVGTRDQRVEVEGDYLISICLKLAQTYSGEIYGRAKLPIPDTLKSPKEFQGAGLESVGVSRAHFEGHRKVLLERLGLSNFDPGKKGDDKKDEKKPEDKKPEEKKP